MIDINTLRVERGGDPEKVRETQRRRYEGEEGLQTVVNVLAADKDWRDAQHRLEGLRMVINQLNKRIGAMKKKKENTSAMEAESKAKKNEIKAAEEEAVVLEARRDTELKKIGNFVHDSVPISGDEKDNVVVKKWGTPRKEGKLKSHVDLVQLLGIADLENGTAVAGGRGFFLRNEGPLLNQALINAALHHGYGQGCEPVMTPFFMRKDIMAECAQLSQFDEELYKVTGEGEDKYLIATSEQPLCAMHRQQWFEERDLPKKYVGYSTCFRKEAGSHGRDTLGIFRIHQFEKVEQFYVTSPDNNASWAALEEMLTTAETFYQALKLPYQVVNIVSGELNSAAAKKYDLEAHFPASDKFRELVSCSNCTDYQSRRLEVRLRAPKALTGEAEKKYCHMLNCTLSATERTLCCLLENYQTPEGVTVPELLRPFMPNRLDFIPFRNMLDNKGRVVPLVEQTKKLDSGRELEEKIQRK